MFDTIINAAQTQIRAVTQGLGSPSALLAIFESAEQKRLAHVRERLAALNAEADALTAKRATLARRLNAANDKPQPPASGTALTFLRAVGRP